MECENPQFFIGIYWVVMGSIAPEAIINHDGQATPDLRRTPFCPSCISCCGGIAACGVSDWGVPRNLARFHSKNWWKCWFTMLFCGFPLNFQTTPCSWLAQSHVVFNCFWGHHLYIGDTPNWPFLLGKSIRVSMEFPSLCYKTSFSCSSQSSSDSVVSCRSAACLVPSAHAKY